MKENILKFKNIKYPLYVLTRKPLRVIYSINTIKIKNVDGTEQLVDNKEIEGDYFTRLLTMSNRVTFDFTCTNLQDVLFSKAKWGIDNNAIPHDLSKLVKVPTDIKSVDRFDKNLVWLKGVSYPFTIPINEEINIEDSVFARVILVNNEWFIKEFLYDKEPSSKTIQI